MKQQNQLTQQANLITFDLDDTLFPTERVFQDSSRVLLGEMNKYLKEKKCQEHISQESFIASSKFIRHEKKNTPIKYTDLRKQAIRYELEQRQQNVDNDRDDESTKLSMDEIVTQIYNKWEEERHASAERHLYPDVIPMLQSLRLNHPSVVIGAITNGEGDPFKMKETLLDYFDFRVSGEDNDVFPHRKPHAGIYNAAKRRYSEMHNERNNYQAKVEVGDGIGSGHNDDMLNWFHIGNDLGKDVGASAACGAKAIWVDLLEAYGQTKELATNNVVANVPKQSQQPTWSSASKKELEKIRALAEKARESSITARVERLSDLPDVILGSLRDTNV